MPTKAKPRRRRRQGNSLHRCGQECPIGTIRVRRHNNVESRFIKVSMQGKYRWQMLARFTWEQMHGKVPAGMRVVHLDGNALNDDPTNYGVMTPGELIVHYHALRPEMSEENRRGTKRRQATAEHNRLRGQIRRATSWLPTRWYAVDPQRCVIYEVPYRSRTALMHDLGLLSAKRKNGKIARKQLAKLPIEFRRGAELDAAEFCQFSRRPLPAMICRVCGCHEHDACWDEVTGSCA